MSYEAHLSHYSAHDLFALENFFAKRPHAEKVFKDLLGTISELIMVAPAHHDCEHLSAFEHELPTQRESIDGILYDTRL